MVDAQIARVVVAHRLRLAQAINLTNQLDITRTPGKCFIDDGFLGEWRNTRRALEWGRQRDVSHVLVLQDDAVPVPGFMDHVHEAVRRRPDDLISLYVGTGRPRAAEVLEAVEEARRSHASWLVADGPIWGVGIVWPVHCVNSFLQWGDRWRHRLPYDQRALAWSQATGRRCYYTWPSLVNHADGPSVIKGRSHQLELVRVAHEVGVPDWNDTEVDMQRASTLRP